MGENKHTGTAMGRALWQGYMVMPEEKGFTAGVTSSRRQRWTQVGVSVGKRQVHFSHGDRS